MKKVLIVYYSSTGNTETMAQYIAEGIRFSGNEAITKRVSEIKGANELKGYDGYIFGSPTYSLDIPKPMKEFLAIAQKAELENKLGGSFGSYSHDVSYKHDDYAPALIFDTLENVYKMKPFMLGPFSLKENLLETGDGMRTCQDYGRVFGEKLFSD